MSADYGIILSYHKVGPYRSTTLFPEYNVEPKDFEEQMKYFTNHYHWVSLEEMVSRIIQKEPLGPKCLCLTFDDGYLNNYNYALPVLTKYRIPATFFIVTGEIGGKNSWDISKGDVEEPLMGHSHLKELLEAGFSLQPHSHTHPYLSQLSDARMEQEIVSSRRILREFTHRPCNIFAYPFGNYDPRTFAILKKHQFSAGCSIIHGANSIHTDIFLLRRVYILHTTSPFRRKLKLSWALTKEKLREIRSRVL